MRCWRALTAGAAARRGGAGRGAAGHGVGQDLETATTAVFRIARKVAKDRVISTVDPEARHGHKTSPAASTATRATPPSTRTARSSPRPWSPPATPVTPTGRRDSSTIADPAATADPDRAPAAERRGGLRRLRLRHREDARAATTTPGSTPRLQDPAAHAPAGKFTKDRSTSTCTRQQVTCPNGITTNPPLHGPASTAAASPTSAHACATCPLRAQCTTPRPAAGSPSATTKTASPPPVPAKPTRPGGPTTAPPAPKSNARSPTSCAAATAADAPGCAAKPESPPTSASSPPPINLARLSTLGLTHTPRRGWALNPT